MISIDTNIVARFFFNDIPDHSSRSRRVFEAAATGQVDLYIPVVVFAEISYLLTKRRRVPRRDAAQALLRLCHASGVTVENEETLTAALAFWRDHGGISLVDCYILALTRHHGMNQIYSFDRGLDRYPGVERIEP